MDNIEVTYGPRLETRDTVPQRPACSSDIVMPARCPHCGGPAEIATGESIYDKTMEKQLYYAVVFCDSVITCGARLDVILDDRDAARTQAVEQWNRRHNR